MPKDISNLEGQEVKLLSASPISLNNKALLELGKVIVNESITVGRDFCKTMVSVSLSGVPVYIGLLKFMLGARHLKSSEEIIMAIFPMVFFLAAAILFIVGYLPRMGELRLDLPEEIENQKRKIIKQHLFFAWAGVVLLFIGIIFSIILFVYFIGS